MTKSDLQKSIEKHQGITGKTLFENLREFYNKVQPFEKHETELLAFAKILSAVENSQGTSTNILITGSSGIGKDRLARDAMSVFPQAKHLEFEHVTKKTLIGLKMDFDKVSVHLNDVTPSIFDEPSYHSLTTRNRGETKYSSDYDKKSGTFSVRESGSKPVIISTTNRISQVRPDHYRRHSNLKLVDTPERKERRTSLFVERSDHPEFYRPSIELRNQLKDLLSLNYFVSVPYGQELLRKYHRQGVPTNFTSHYGKILDWIRAYTVLLHKEGEGIDKNGILHLRATPEIYDDYVHPLILKLFDGELQGLLGKSKEIYELLKISARKIEGWTMSEIQELYHERFGYPIKYETISRHLRNLKDDGIVELDLARINEHNGRPVLTCHFINQEFKFPKLKEGAK